MSIVFSANLTASAALEECVSFQKGIVVGEIMSSRVETFTKESRQL